MKVFEIIPKDHVDQLKQIDYQDDTEESESDDDDLFTIQFRCRHCSARFNLRQQLLRHLKKKHSKTRAGGNRGVKTCRVVLNRLRYSHIEVSTPKKGIREIYYTSEENSDWKKTQTELEISSDSSEANSSKFIHWRCEKIKALQKKIVPPEPPTVHKNSHVTTQPSWVTSSKSTAVDEIKTLHLEVPVVNSFMFNVNGLKDDVHSILNVISGQKMSSVVLDAYLTRRIDIYNNKINAGIRSGYKLRPISSTNFQYLPVTFLPVLRKDLSPTLLKPNYKYLPKVPLDENCVLIAPLFACNHFYLAVFNCYAKKVYVYDSSWTFLENNLRLRHVVRVLTSVFPLSRHIWDIHFKFSCAMQLDDLSCGYYVIYYTENHLKSKSHRNVRNMSADELNDLRREIVMELLPTTKHGTQFLEAITE